MRWVERASWHVKPKMHCLSDVESWLQLGLTRFSRMTTCFFGVVSQSRGTSYGGPLESVRNTTSVCGCVLRIL